MRGKYMLKDIQSMVSMFFIVMVMVSCSTNNIKTNDNYEVVELPDGSIAYLNKHSELKYNTRFDPRRVHLNGEAFLKVSEGESAFVVETDQGEVVVMGTEFNVKAYAEEIEVEVEQGTVEIKSKIKAMQIGRGEVARLKKGEDGFTIGKAEFKYKVWMKELTREFKKLGRELKRNSKELGKDAKKLGKELNNEAKKLKSN